MHFFDIVATEDASVQELAGRLGYEHLFYVGREVEIVESLKQQGWGGKKKIIVRSDSFEVITKCLKQNEVIGMLPAAGPVSKKTLEILKKEDKLLFIPFSDIVRFEDARRMQSLIKLRNLVRSALMSKARICIVSMAEDREDMMSQMQMIEVANFLGIEQRKAKEALCALGGLI
jgi:RNase P/RNase MRP subunit p30